MTKTQDAVQIAERAFKAIADRFPTLAFVRDETDPVEISINMPVQLGLSHEVWLCLQNRDELHFSTGSFWLEWFPCTKPSVVEAYLDAVTGFLAGEYRVLEHYRGSKCVKAQLQAPSNDDWRTIGTTIGCLLPKPWLRKSTNIVRNTQASR